NMTAVMNPAGNVQERYAYDPFGQVSYAAPDWSSRSTSSVGWVYLHQGGRFETVVALYHFRNRDYSPVLGRWTSIDPIGFKSRDLNLYGYVRDNATGSLDPSGLCGKKEAEKIKNFMTPNVPVGTDMATSDSVADIRTRAEAMAHRIYE